MGYQVYKIGGRYCGYGVPAYCEHPDCNKEIDRGMSYACGGEPGDNDGTCDRYFCSEHLNYFVWDEEGEKECEHEEDCDCRGREVCKPCTSRTEFPFPYKPEHPTWIKHLLTDPSWEEWRKNNPDEIKSLQETGYHVALSHFAAEKKV